MSSHTTPPLTLSLYSTSAPLQRLTWGQSIVVLFILMDLWVLLVSWFLFCFFPVRTHFYYHPLIPLFMLRAYLWELWGGGHFLIITLVISNNKPLNPWIEPSSCSNIKFLTWSQWVRTILPTQYPSFFCLFLLPCLCFQLNRIWYLEQEWVN